MIWPSIYSKYSLRTVLDIEIRRMCRFKLLYCYLFFAAHVPFNAKVDYVTRHEETDLEHGDVQEDGDQGLSLELVRLVLFNVF